MSVVPMQATTSAIRRPSASFGSDCRFTNDGARTFTRYGFAEPSLATKNAQLAARRFDRLVDFARRRRKSFGENFEVIDEPFDRRFHFLARRRNDSGHLGADRPFAGIFSMACRTILMLSRISATRTR